MGSVWRDAWLWKLAYQKSIQTPWFRSYIFFEMTFDTFSSHTQLIICLFHYSASAAWLTGGQVDKIEVYENEGGVAHFRGGIRPCIIPAGYVGVSFWAGIFVAMSGSRVGATVSACIFLLALLVCLT